MEGNLNNLCDCRFNYKSDNPFNGPTKDECLTKLKKYILQNINDFRNVDWITDSRSYNIPKTSAFETEIGKKLEDNPNLCYYTCSFLNKLSNKLSKPITPKLLNYVTNHLNKPEDSSESEEQVEVKPIIIEGGDKKNEEPVYFENHIYDGPDALQFIPTSEPVYKSNVDLYTYDARPGKMLTYQEVCELTLNIARTQLQNIIRKDDSVLFAESREKNRLISELNKYLKNSEIAAKLNLQPDNLSIPQLQQSLDQAKDLYETIKVTHVIEKGLDLFNLGYTYIFPNGIKIPKKNKAIKLNGVTGSFKQLLFDRTSPLNIAFKNILEKHHIEVSDEFVVGLSSLEAILKKIEIVDVEPEKKSNTKVESISETSEQNSGVESINNSLDDLDDETSDYESE